MTQDWAVQVVTVTTVLLVTVSSPPLEVDGLAVELALVLDVCGGIEEDADEAADEEAVGGADEDVTGGRDDVGAALEVGQATDGLAVTQTQRALADAGTPRATPMPQPSMTQLIAAAWIWGAALQRQP